MEKVLLLCKSIASIEEVTQDDITILKLNFWMCHVGPNYNNDYFTPEFLKSAYPTAKFKAINLEHGLPIVGTIVNAKYEYDPVASKDGLLCEGVIWKIDFPHVAQSVMQGYKDGSLAMSMEVYFKDCEYWLGDGDDKQVLSPQEYQKNSRYDKPVYRVFKLPGYFNGCALTRNPADPNALILAAANKCHPVLVYHDLLHRYYEQEIFDYMSEKEIIREHCRIHQEFASLLT